MDSSALLRAADFRGWVSVAAKAARKLLFTVGAHEGLKSGSETGRKGVAGKGGRKTPLGHLNGRSEARFTGSSARKWVAWREILKRENTVSPSQAKEDRCGSENFC